MVKEKLEAEQFEQYFFTEEEQYRLIKLKQKQENQRFEVAFCGHFSAGKSTILNKLLGADVLPTSPIPTSANIVSIKNGPLSLHVQGYDGKSKKWTGEIPWEKVREWGMDGNKIADMTISAPLPFLNTNSYILDTPGVDSTDDSHQAVTVDQLYTTDVIVYVMDYNHVQSETNLYFLKQLSQEKKPIYIIVNQIDKHNEEEIPLAMFKRSMEDVFKRWDIHFLKLYFTTMKYPDHSLNQFAQFEKEMKSLLYHSEPLMPHSLERLNEGVLQAVKSRLSEQQEEQIEEIVTQMKEKGYSPEQLELQNELQTKLTAIANYPNKLDEQYETELGNLFKTVTLFPFSTTDLARTWIESLQPGFKVGLLFTKKKTEEEQERRLTLLVHDLQDKVKSQLLFHIQQFFQKIDRTKLADVERFESKVNALNYEVTSDLLKGHVKADYASREYVFTFTKEITAIIVKKLRQISKEIVVFAKAEMEATLKKEAAAIEKELEKLAEIEEFVQLIEETKVTYAKKIAQVDEQLVNFENDHSFEEKIVAAMEKTFPDVEVNDFGLIQLPTESVIDTSWEMETEVKSDVDFEEERTEKWLSNIKNVLLQYKEKKLLKHERERLVERVERYQNQTFIISLFGAFSAGKSSFANALIGDHVLPVSPNPTTATVNTVEFPRNGYVHGQALVYVKTEKDLNKEIETVSEQIDENINLRTIEKWQPKMSNYVTSWQKTYAEYLETMRNSIKQTTWRFGNQFVVSHEQLHEIVAKEENACLIEKVTIFYDCPITRQGIVLVDTPGVNSIHGRHTNVAFQQLRQSDAIFYLTYYNHAFSKADQYFLQQMAKVNESFRHDKLYFVINAADLANSERELNGVRKHVYDQLQRNGIASPRLFHLSSKLGLQAKLEGKEEKTDFTKFERTFYDFTILELKKLSVIVIEEELKQFYEKMLDSISFINEEKEIQTKKHQQLVKEIETEKAKLKKAPFDYVYRDILQEKEQLTLYLRERMTYVLNDYFSTVINVSVLTGNNKKTLHAQLEGAIKEWKGLGEYFLQQELEATTIRLEQKMKERLLQWLEEKTTLLKETFPHFYVSTEIEDCELNNETSPVHLNINGRSYTTFLKSKREFFEQGAMKQMKEQLVKDGTEASTILIETVSSELSEAIEATLSQLEDKLKGRIIEGMEQERLRFEAIFDEEEKVSLEEEREKLKKYLV